MKKSDKIRIHYYDDNGYGSSIVYIERKPGTAKNANIGNKCLQWCLEENAIFHSWELVKCKQ